MPVFENNAVKKVFNEYQPQYRKPLLHLRSLLLQVASETEGVGKLEET